MATKPKRKFLMVPLRTRQDEKVIQMVSEALRRNKADAARELFYREAERLAQEEQNQLNAQPA